MLILLNKCEKIKESFQFVFFWFIEMKHSIKSTNEKHMLLVAAFLFLRR